MLLDIAADSSHPTVFWHDIWLISISFMMFLGTIYVYFKLRASTFRRVRKLLEERVEIKTKQLSEKNTELEKLSLVASKTDNAVMVTDSKGKIDWVNDAFIRMINVREDVVGTNAALLTISNDFDQMINH